MKKNILILWLGVFGYAVACHLGRNNSKLHFYATEKNPEIFKKIQETREHPYFFTDIVLPENIELVENADLRSLLQKTDIIISVIPCQFTDLAFREMKDFLKPWVMILNLSKGIDNQTLKTSSETLEEVLGTDFQISTNSLLNSWSHTSTNSLLNSLSFQEKEATTSKVYSYAYLAGGMIAEELVEWKKLWADLVIARPVSWDRSHIGEYLKQLFHSETLDINLKIWNPKNTELAAALKNIVALILWYYEWQWAWASTLGYYFAKLTREMSGLIELLGNSERIDFSDYAFSGDLIATCFGNSRNRLLGNMLGKWMEIQEALTELTAQKKIAEGYETLKWIKSLIEWKEGFEEIEKFSRKYL